MMQQPFPSSSPTIAVQHAGLQPTTISPTNLGRMALVLHHGTPRAILAISARCVVVCVRYVYPERAPAASGPTCMDFLKRCCWVTPIPYRAMPLDPVGAKPSGAGCFR